MSIYDTINTQMKVAMKAKDLERLGALRGIRAAFLTEMKKDNSEKLGDEACVGLLRRLEKQRKESIEAFTKGNREEQAEAERRELAVIQEFLPSLADEETTRAWLRAAIDATGAQSKRDAGRVMGRIMKEHHGDVDGAMAKQLLDEMLGE